ncbi:hypothetical protein JW826_03625 [Candidatus Woesearchaeota archaeon]|nr:hypothetical protein [Candidatus Woesearchaeota archaeon]
MKRGGVRGPVPEMTLLVALAFFSLITIPELSSAAACDATNTPQMNSRTILFALDEGGELLHDFNLTNMDEAGVKYTYAFLENSFTGIILDSKGLMSFAPDEDDSGEAILVLVAAKDACAGTLIITIRVAPRPRITLKIPEEQVIELNLSQNVSFKVDAETPLENKTLFYEWLLDNTKTGDGKEYVLHTGYKLYGEHNVTVRVKDTRGLLAEHVWLVRIAKVNLAPILLQDIPGAVIFKNAASGAYFLEDYFFDAERGKMTFTGRQVLPTYSTLTYANVSAEIGPDSYVTYNPATNSTGLAYYIFTAKDQEGLTTESNMVKVDVLKEQQVRNISSVQVTTFCGDYSCNSEENCSSCSFDCGLCNEGSLQGCMPKWNCTQWTECPPSGVQFRNCTDINECGDSRSMPDTSKTCQYLARCDDGLKNGLEEGVDCGGPCNPCANCTDRKKNQGEEGVDCGGPCRPCAACNNGRLDLNETDIDCGGSCLPCEANKTCQQGKDCKSLNCTQKRCAEASCFDGVKNQHEEKIDCGGPCEAICANCTDGVQNGNEQGVDCGGPCRPCATCDDGEKNDGEFLTDCGGPCRRCGLTDLIGEYLMFFIILGFFVVFSIMTLTGYFFFLLSRPEEAERLYESDTIFVFLTELHHFCRICRRIVGRKNFLPIDDYNRYKGRISEFAIKEEYTNKELYNMILDVLSAMLSLPPDFDEDMFYKRMRGIAMSPFIKVLLIGYYNKIRILATDNFIPTEEQQEFITELKFLLLELSRA